MQPPLAMVQQGPGIPPPSLPLRPPPGRTPLSLQIPVHRRRLLESIMAWPPRHKFQRMPLVSFVLRLRDLLQWPMFPLLVPLLHNRVLAHTSLNPFPTLLLLLLLLRVLPCLQPPSLPPSHMDRRNPLHLVLRHVLLQAQTRVQWCPHQYLRPLQLPSRLLSLSKAC